ncbi:FAR1-related protein, partial [Sesbania bispinosa]
MHNFERAINEYRHNELAFDIKSLYTEPVLTTALEKYEVAASKFYTRNTFFMLKLNKFESSDSEYVVLFDKST